jgi:hypothetical protein
MDSSLHHDIALVKITRVRMRGISTRSPFNTIQAMIGVKNIWYGIR